MRMIKRVFALMLTMVIVLGPFATYAIKATELIEKPLTPNISVKLIKKKTGVKITVSNADPIPKSYSFYISGDPAISEYRKFFKHKNLYRDNKYDYETYKHYEIRSDKKSIIIKDLEPGTYTVKAKYNIGSNYSYYNWDSDWSEEKTFTLKEAAAKGYATSYDFTKVKEGQVVKFGCYEQDFDHTNGKEPIEWIVLEKTKDSVFLLSRYALDMMPYNIHFENVTWETCSIRKYLNNEFLKNSFNITERRMLKTTILSNDDNPYYGTDGGKKTKDKVFLLSLADVTNPAYGFLSDFEEGDINRKCSMWYSKNIKEENPVYATLDGNRGCYWWLRSPGESSDRALTIDQRWDIHENICGDRVTMQNTAIRPALYVKLKSE